MDRGLVGAAHHHLDVVVGAGLLAQPEVDRPPAGDRPPHADGVHDRRHGLGHEHHQSLSDDDPVIIAQFEIIVRFTEPRARRPGVFSHTS